jgi:large subunit ribosomal protein L23
MLLKDIIIRPYQTEKTLELTEKLNQYAFIVNRNANKIQIRKAIEDAFKVKVVRINTILVKGKPRRYRGRIGRTQDYKKAFVTLKKGEKIEFA